jgi:hypothetical protein
MTTINSKYFIAKMTNTVLIYDTDGEFRGLCDEV